MNPGMEPGIRDGSGIPRKKALLNGSLDDESLIPSQLIQETLALDERAPQIKCDVENPPIGAGNREDRLLLPKLSNQSKDEVIPQKIADSVSKPMPPDFFDSNPDSHLTLQRTAEKSVDDKNQIRNEIVVMEATSFKATTSNSPENQQSAPLDNPPTEPCPVDVRFQKSNLIQTCAENESDTKPFQLNTPHSAIDSNSEQDRVVDASIKPKEQPCNNTTPTTSSLTAPESSSNRCIESVEATGETGMDVLVEEYEEIVNESKNEVTRSSLLSMSPNSAFGETKSEQSETTNNSRATSRRDPLTSSSDSQRPTATDTASSSRSASSSQKSSSKLRGNAMIYVPYLSEELMQGYRILTEIFGDKCKSFVWPFLDPVDTDTLWDYESKIKHPMWLRKIESKFVNKEYQSITEFAVDIRQMLENCYRYNGIKHQISKYAQTLECVFEQKLALLSRPLQEKTTLYVTSDGKYNDGCPNTVELSSGRLRRTCTRLASRALEQKAAAPLAFHIKQELEQQEREEKRQKIVDRRDEIIKERQDLLEWDKQLIGETQWTYMKSIWEIPAIGHFLCLCQSSLELEEISFFELERSFAIPMESMILRRIFTTLLSTPYQRTRLGKKPPMPYKVWEARLREWVRGWYVVYNKLGDPTKVYEKIGVPERFFEVLGPHFPLDRVQYHELTYYERVWIMKALCDQLFETQMSIRRCVLAQPVEEQRPIILGVDGEANSYVHFPQFCGADLRIYRQSKYPDLLKKSKKDRVKTEEMEDPTEEQYTQRRKYRKGPAARKRIAKPKPVIVETPRSRPSRLRQRLTTTVHYGTYAESVISSTESEDVTSEFTEMEDEPESDSQSECQSTSNSQSECQAASNSQSECQVTSRSQSEGQTISGSQSKDCTTSNSQSEGHPTSNSQSKCPTTSDEPQEDAKPMDGVQEEEIVKDPKRDNGDSFNKSRANEECETVAEIQTGEEKHQPSHTTGVVKQEPTLTVESMDSRVDYLNAELKPSPTEQLCNGETTSSHSSTTSENISLEGHPKSYPEQETKDGIFKDAEKCRSPSFQNGTSSQGSDFSASAEHSIKTEGEAEAAAASEGSAVTEEPNTNNNSSQTLDIHHDMKLLAEPNDKPCGDTAPNAGDDTVPTAGDDTGPPASPPKPHVEVLPVLGEFELVCDSMESLKELVDKFGPPESKPLPPTTGRKRKATMYVKPPVRKRCEKELHEKLTNLLLELTPYEAKLAKFAIRNRERFKKEYEAAQTAPETDQDIKDIWASEESSSESASDAESESDEEAQPAKDNDEDWDACSEGMKLRKRSAKKSAAAAQDADEEAGETVQEDVPKKPKRPRPSGRRSPPHKNQLNTSLMGLFKSLSTDGLQDACKRLQTMIKRAESTRNHMFLKSKISPASLSGCGDGQAVMAFLNKFFWFGAKPPAVEGKVAKTVEELTSTYPTFVHNLIFRNIKSGLSKLANTAKSTSHDSTNQKNEPESKEESDIQSEPSQEAVQSQSTEGENMSDALTSSGRIETRSSVSNTSQENNSKLESNIKTKEVMDDFTLAGLYTVLSQTKGLLRERLATGLSELLPDYPNLQDSVVKIDQMVKNEHGDSVQPSLPSSRSETDKELLLKMLPKPSQYLRGSKSAAEGSAHVTHVKYISNEDIASMGSTIKPGNSLIVPVPTSKLPFMPKSRSKTETAKAAIPAIKPAHPITQATATTGSPQLSDNPGAVPHGVYTIKVDASVWSQLQGKPELQQQFVLQQIKEMQRKQTESGSSTDSTGSLNNPAQAVTCIRSPPKAQATVQKPSSQTRPTPARNTGRISQTTNLQNISDLSSLQPIKLSKPARPKASAKHHGGLPEPASNLSQKELIALLQQQQRQLQLHRQQQQEKQLLKQKNEQQPQQQQQTHTQQHAKQQFVLSASGALLLPPQPQQVTLTGMPKTPIVPGVGNTSQRVVPSCVQPSSAVNSSVQPTIAPSLASHATKLSTKTTVTAAVKQPKMTTNLNNPQPGAVASSATTILSQSGQQPQIIHRALVPQNPVLVSNPPKSPGSQLHLVQTNNGTQFVVRTGSLQAPRLQSQPSAGIIGNPRNTFPVVMAGQNSQAAAIGVTSANSTVLALPQTAQFLMQPSQAVPNTAKCQPQSVQGSCNSLLGQATTSVYLVGATQAGPQSNQDTPRRANNALTNQSVGQLAQPQRQTAPVVIQKPQLAVLKGLGDSKVIVGSPTKMVRLVHPSHLSTAATFVPTSVPGQVGSLPVVVTKAVQVAPQGVQVVGQAPAQQQLVHPPVQPGKMESVPSALVAQGSPSASGTIIQEHLHQVVLQQLAAGKLKLTPQTIPVSQIVHQVNQQQAPNQQPKAAQVVNTNPLVLSQQAPQLITKVQQSLPTTIKTSPPISGTDALFDRQLQASIKILSQAKTGQGSAVRLLAAPSMTNQGNLSGQEPQRLQLVSAASSVTGPACSLIQVPAVQNSPTQIAVQASHLVLAQPSLNNQAISPTVPTQFILQTESNQLMASPQNAVQKGVKRSSFAPVVASVVKVPRVTAPDQAATAQAVPATTFSGFPPNTTTGVS
ncbi:uncharacterized protein LOC119725873 [Patiria miniata]|uniref:Bromo domain-containing protein n=1 Tax=Patiria miniata TaxID=46514 RepID=A0A913ZNT7_PATMI|nr:uncharacterized protein LOC119725873 [Patiria miniata]XP_038053396.1 uncharacterized protein LOC119725873 [Patiria miniata]XP_038053397.1 uncharacterized protein LOC119725873 [Patiria miniata]